MLSAPSPRNVTVRPGERALVLADREQVGEQLARVEVVGERVDHRHRRAVGHLHEPGLRVGAPDDRRDLPLEHARGVGRALLAAELAVGRRDDERLPPRSAMPTANDTRVRVDDLSKITATVCGPASGLRPQRSALICSARSRIAVCSAWVRSSSRRKCRVMRVGLQSLGEHGR